MWSFFQSSVSWILDIFNKESPHIFNVIKQRKKRANLGLTKICGCILQNKSRSCFEVEFLAAAVWGINKKKLSQSCDCILCTKALACKNCISKARTKRRQYPGLQDVLGGFPILIYWMNYKTQWINNTNMEVNVTLILLSIPLVSSVRLQRCNRERLKSSKSEKNIILLFPS